MIHKVSSSLLESTRRLNKILQSSGPDGVMFSDITNVLSEIQNCNVFVSSRKGRILGYSKPFEKSTQPFDEANLESIYFTESYNETLLSYNDTKANINSNTLYQTNGLTKSELSKIYTTIVPIRCGGDRLGTLIFEYFKKEFTTDDLILAEYSATVVGMEIMRSKTEEIEEEARKKAVVQIAIGTLSYSEFEAVEHIFRELDGSEGLLVASKIADRVGITRSVIVNALRKFESAGVIESRSLGMKGTHIKILNDKLLPELEKSK